MRVPCSIFGRESSLLTVANDGCQTIAVIFAHFDLMQGDDGSSKLQIDFAFISSDSPTEREINNNAYLQLGFSGPSRHLERKESKFFRRLNQIFFKAWIVDEMR
jgi:hypothetical protein